MSNEAPRLPNPDRALDTIQVILVPISIGVSIILGQTQVPGLILTAAYTFTGGNLAVLVFRKIFGLLPPPKK
jgi:hypothetical protein